MAIAVHRRPRFLFLPPSLVVFGGWSIGMLVRDRILTREEVEGLMSELLVSNEPPRGTRRLDDWLLQYGDRLGRHYASELDRHFRK